MTMQPPELLDRIEQLADESERYLVPAYLFVFRCLDHCRRRLGREGHVTGGELGESARDLALADYGPMAKAVLNHWGIDSTEDIGAIVFQMIEAGLLSKTEEDSIDDFRGLYDFEEVFVRRYPW